MYGKDRYDILIVVEGGVVVAVYTSSNVHAFMDGEIKYKVLDFDNIKAGDKVPEDYSVVDGYDEDLDKVIADLVSQR